jgi:large subunit ribosomal protein L24
MSVPIATGSWSKCQYGEETPEAQPEHGDAGGHCRERDADSRFQCRDLQSGTGKADRVGIKILDDGRKVRIFKSNNEVVDV